MNARNLLPLLGLLVTTPVALAQSFNIDIGTLNATTPSAAYGAGAGQLGQWMRISGELASPVALTDLNGNLTGVTAASSGGLGNFGFDNAATLGDDQNLLDDAQDVGQPPLSTGSLTWTFSGLAAGNYALYTYAWGPDDASFRSGVSVAGANEGLQQVGGTFAGSHGQGLTYALHTKSVANGTLNLTVTSVIGPGTVNGFQIVKLSDGSPFTSFCFGDGTSAACPCANFGATGRGCNNSQNTGGALLVASGSVNPDTVVLTSSGELPSSLTIFLQGDANAAPGVVFGDGIRCAGGTLKRLYAKSASGGVATAPGVGDAGIRVQSASLGDTISPGSTRYYQTYYRDSDLAFCAAPTGNTYNSSSAVAIVWP